MKRLMVYAATVAALAGCSAVGVKVDESKVDAFKPGVTTRAQVVEALGEPTSQISHSDGTETVYYSYSEGSARPESFIPLIGPFVGGMDSTSNNVGLRFSRAGKLLGIEKSSMNSGAGMGFAGSKDNRRPAKK